MATELLAWLTHRHRHTQGGRAGRARLCHHQLEHETGLGFTSWPLASLLGKTKPLNAEASLEKKPERWVGWKGGQGRGAARTATLQVWNQPGGPTHSRTLAALAWAASHPPWLDGEGHRQAPLSHAHLCGLWPPRLPTAWGHTPQEHSRLLRAACSTSFCLFRLAHPRPDLWSP